MSVYSRASLECVAILMWFYFHARDPFVSIIIIRLEDGDLLGLMATVMPLSGYKKQLHYLDVCHVTLL